MQKRRLIDYKKQGIRKFAMRLCLLVISEGTPIKPYLYVFPNENYTRMMPIDIPKLAGEN